MIMSVMVVLTFGGGDWGCVSRATALWRLKPHWDITLITGLIVHISILIVLHNNDYQSCGKHSNDGEDGGQRGQGNPNHLRMIMTAMMMVLMIVVMMMVVVVVVVTVVMMMLVTMVNGKATKVTCSTKSVLQQPMVTPASAIELTILRARLFY